MDNLNAIAPDNAANAFSAHTSALSQRYQTLLDTVTPFTVQRWAFTAGVIFLFMLRIFFAQGWYIVCYALGIYLLNLFLAFLTPKFDPSLEQEMQDEETEEGSLPTKAGQEFRPFIRRLPEFKFWHSATRASLFSLVASFFAIFDVPVFWPILLFYFIILFFLTMRRQLEHMRKYRYVPFDLPWRKRHASK
ncbi:retention in endoplasmic reticulum protein 1 [Saitoella coloradoensis]